MSFRINTNVNAMNAMRNLASNNQDFSKSITRLSTGLRINSAADDPAGLIQSEKLRAQIGGLNQAIKNSQDAINYAKTAEGAFTEVNKLLNDARTVAVAASNSATESPPPENSAIAGLFNGSTEFSASPSRTASMTSSRRTEAFR